MPDKNVKPWDSRLMEWMSRNSDTAQSKTKPLRFWFGLAAVWAIYAVVAATTGSRDWIVWASLAAVYVFSAIARWRYRSQSRNAELDAHS
jgi:hypothetical protein